MAELGLIRRIFGTGRSRERRRKPRVDMPRGVRVLVVDDSAMIRAVLARMLGQNGYSVHLANDGVSALDRAREERPDLVFLDIVMPGMSGFEVLRALRHDPRTQAIPVIMISGNPQATEQFYVQRFGADDFLKKPFRRGDVFERIARLAQLGRLVVARRAEPGAGPAAAPHAAADDAPPATPPAGTRGAP